MLRYIVAILLALSVFGCAPTKPQKLDELPVEFVSEDIEKRVEIVAHRAERLPSGHVEVLLVCKSKEKKKPIWFDWKVIFIDSRGLRAEESEWHTEQAFPKLELTLRASSFKRDIADYRFLLRAPRQ